VDKYRLPPKSNAGRDYSVTLNFSSFFDSNAFLLYSFLEESTLHRIRKFANRFYRRPLTAA